MNILQKQDCLIRNRYRLIEILSDKNFQITYKAEDIIKNNLVVIKSLSLRNIHDWKILDLFEREAKILSSLNHHGIPRYLDYFFEDSLKNRHFYLVQELISGQSLGDLVTQGWHGNEAEIKAITKQILEILKYLQGYKPAVIHRDIKPDNIIRRDDGKIFLVDFGSVKERFSMTLNKGNTFVGTLGYIPPEQLQGKAYFASDLYSLGATALFLLTHRSLDELPHKKMKVKFRSQVSISEPFADWLEKMLEPIVEERFTSAKEALKALNNNQGSCQKLPLTRPQPKGSRIDLMKTNQYLKIKIPPSGLHKGSYKIFFLTLITNIFTVLVTWVAASWKIPILIYLFMLPLWVTCLAMWSLFIFITTASNYLEIEPKIFRLGWRCLIFKYHWQGKTVNIKNAALEMQTNLHKKKNTRAVIQEKLKKHKFGWGTTVIEKTWLVAEVKDFLEKREPITRKYN